MRFTVSTDELEEAKQILSVSDAFRCLSDIRMQVFRPARKHGYGDARHGARLNELLQKEEVSEAIHLLEELYSEVLREYGLLELE